MWLTAIFALGGTAGMYFGGEWAGRYARDNERLQLKAMTIVVAGFGVISTGVYLSHNVYVAYGMMGLGAVVLSTVYGPLFGTIQTLVPQNMRATAIAFIYLFANLIGMGLGPLAAGALSDVLRPRFGEESLRYALLALCPGYLWAMWHLWRASRTVTRDIQEIQTHQNVDHIEDHIALNSSVESFPT